MVSILIVDDEKIFRNLIRKMLESSDCRVLEAGDGNQAIQILKNQQIDLVIADIIMPEKGGLVTIHEIKQMDSDTKIIAISGGGHIDAEDYLQSAKAFGADATIEKPIDLNLLVSTIKSLLPGSDGCFIAEASVGCHGPIRS